MDPENQQEGSAAGSSASRTCTIQNKLGLHARAAALFVQTASKFPCEIFLARDGNEVNGKSIMGVLTLAASKGTDVTLRADGPEATAALARLCELIENKFGEE